MFFFFGGAPARLTSLKNVFKLGFQDNEPTEGKQQSFEVKKNRLDYV